MCLTVLSSCMVVLLANWHYVVLLLLWDSHVFTGEEKEEREEIRETKNEKKSIAIHFVCLCLRFFSVQINLQEFNHWVQQTALRSRLKNCCKNFVCKHIRSIWGGNQIRTFALSLNCYQLQLISSGRIILRHGIKSTLLNGDTLWVYDRPMKRLYASSGSISLSQIKNLIFIPIIMNEGERNEIKWLR